MPGSGNRDVGIALIVLSCLNLGVKLKLFQILNSCRAVWTTDVGLLI